MKSILSAEADVYKRQVQEDVPAQAARDGLSLEEAGRNARRRVFEHLAEKCQASVIALAHHQRDQAETMPVSYTHLFENRWKRVSNYS